MLPLLLICLLLIASSSIYVKRDTIKNQIKSLFRQKFGLVQLDQFHISYNKKTHLAIHITGVCIHKPSNQNPQTHQQRSMVKRLMSSPACKAFPFHIVLATLANYITLHLDHLHIKLDDSLSLKVGHIYINSKFRQDTLSLQVQVGPILVLLGAQSLVEMTSACLVTLTACHFKRVALLNLEVQLGKTNINLHHVNLLKTQQRQGDSQTNVKRYKDMFNAVRVTAQCLRFIFCVNSQLTLSSDVNGIHLDYINDNTPSVRFHTETIRFCLAQQCLLLMSGMEMTTAQQPAVESPPNIEFLTITWILDAPLLTLPLANQSLLDAIKGIEKSSTQETSSTVLPQKILNNLPMFTLAIVLNSPKLELQDIDDQQRSGYLQSKRLIMRLSGEYLVKGRNSCLDDVPSSSSSSASNLDSYFAQEEYKWLSGNSRSSSASSLNKQKNRHSMYEFNETERMTPANTKTDRWLNLMGRVSRSRKNNDANATVVEVDNTLQQKHVPHRRWTYRVSAKLIVQRVSLGYTTHLQESIKEFIRIKNAVLILKSRLHVNNNQQEGRYETLFVLGNMIQSEAAIDKPMITVWEDAVVSASTFWLQAVPHALSSALSKKENDTKKPLPHWAPALVQNASFSLDVTQGSLVVWSKDACHTTTVNVPSGYIDNTPKHTVYTRMILDTEKFTFVCETGNIVNEWRSRCHIEKLYVHQSSSNLQQVLEKDEKQHVLLWISQLNFATKYIPHVHKREGSVTVKIKKYGISYSIRNHYACLLLVRSLATMKHQLTSLRPSTPSSVDTDTVKLPLHWELLINVARGDVQIGLPQDTKLYLRMDGLEIQHKSPEPTDNIIRFRNVMILGVSPLRTSEWEQLIELDKLQIALVDGQIELKARKIFVSMPYKYVLSAVIDNVIALVKAIKDLHLRLLKKQQDAFTYFGPNLNNDPILIPCIRLRTKVLSVQFDDDPFEAKLRRILKTGLMEQQRRLAYREALDDKIQDLLAVIPPSSDTSLTKSSDQQSDSITTSSTIHIPHPGKDSNSSSPSTPVELDVHAQIAEAEKNLLGYYSQFWIKHINESTNEETQFYQELYQRENYRNLMTAKALDEGLDDGDIQSRRHDSNKTFSIDIAPRPLHAPLLNFSAQFVKVNFRPADFALEDTRSFIHTIGGGVPFSNDFSIIIPFHLSIKAGMTWIKVRDYPLPLLYVPPPVQSQDNNNYRVSWRLEGNYALGDELGNSGGSRIIPVSIIPAIDDGAGYCLDAVRTASPLKFYSVIDYQILTHYMSMICVSVSYGPAIQDVIHVLETLAPGQVDPSPRLGFWDKVRFVIHTETKFSFVGGGDLAFVVKGTRDPYQLQGRGAGLAKIWSDDVICRLGYSNLQNEFIQIISQGYKFGVPDLVRGGYVPLLPDALPYKNDKIMASVDHKFLKVALKLSDGIRMGIGMSFERLSCSTDHATELCFKCANKPRQHIIHRCRSQEFSPHYQVLFQSVQQVNQHYQEGTYDAFRGFRSDFVHLSFSIVKLEAEPDESIPDFSKDDPYFSHTGSVSQNAMYLSPCFIEHFVQWWRLFGSPVSIPIRHGKLFPSDEPKSKSLGDHLNTVKYKIVINPLAIGFFCTDQDTYLDVKGGGSAGLKARMNTFSVDLHARREVVRQHEDEDEAALKTERNFHEIEIGLSDIDLRVIRASSHRNRRRGSTDTKTTTTAASVYRSMSGSASIPLSDHTDSTSSSSFGNQEKQYSFQWVDPSDYAILDSVPQQQQMPCRSRVEVFPFVFSPLFNFVRQDNEHDAERRDYLRQTHDCIFGTGMASDEFQMAHLNRRASELDKVIENHDKQLDIIIQAMNVYKNERENLTEDCNLLCEKLENLKIKRYMLHTYIGQRILDTELNMSHECSSPQTTTSSIGRRDELSRWETLMGHFRDRFFIHNPQIIWNNSVRDAIYYWQDIKNNRSVQDYNLSARCLKFLEDLVKTAEKQQQWKPDLPSAPSNTEENSEDSSSINDSSNNDTFYPVSDKSVTQALIDKLLSERSDKFVAYNEKEEDKTKSGSPSSTNTSNQQNQDSTSKHASFDENNAENVNDPDYQYKNIPENYEMKSKYLIDMINPQVNFQSDKGLNHLILLTNERIHVKAFGIIDHSTSGAADKDVRLVKDRIIVSLDNAQLLVARKMQDIHSFSMLTQNCYGQFQESHWAAWVQPEQLWYYRDLQLFENFQRVATQLSGTIQLDRYNHLRIKINKYNTSRKSPFEDRTNTMQLHFPQFKLILNSLQGHILYYTLINLLLGNDGSPRKKERLSRFREVMLAAERSDLAETVKQVRVLQNRSRYLLDMHRRFVAELPYLDLLGIREFHNNKRKMREKLEDLYLVVEAIRSIQTFRRDIHLEETGNAMRFIFTSDEIVWEAVKDDAEQSSLCKWILINTKYVFLEKPNGSTKNTIEVDKMQIRNTTKSPVFTNVLDAYIDPANPNQPDYSRHKMLSGVLDSLPPVGGIPIIQHLEINLLPLHLQISTAFGTAMKDYFFPRIESMNEEFDINNNDGELVSDNDEEYSSDIEDGCDHAEMEGLKVAKGDAKSIEKGSTMSLIKREGSFVSFDMLTKKVKETVTGKPKAKADELTIMKKRSSTNRTFIYVRIPAAKHCLSLQGPTQSTFYNLYNFPFKQPKLEYRNKTWSMAEMMEEIQKQFLRAILRHSPALIKRKLLANYKQQIPTTIPPNTQTIATNTAESSMIVPAIVPTTTNATQLLTSSNIDLMGDSVIYNKSEMKDAKESSISFHTEEEEEGDEGYIDNDVHSLYSNDPEEEQQRLAELQTIEKRAFYNVDKELLDVYMKTYKQEQETEDELVAKGKILFGENYYGASAL